jgi:hypothetical protein
MATNPTIDLRPRTAGEVLDDAWRLALAEAPLLLALSGLFAVPAAAALLLLLTQPAPDSSLGRYVLPALTALLLPLTGLGSAACQELFRRRAAGERVTLGVCLRAALRRAPQHAAGRALTLLGVGLGTLAMVLPGLTLWVSLGTLHSILVTGDGRLFAALRDSARDAQREPARSGAVILSRLPLLVISVVNLFLLAQAALWVAGSPAGLDVAFLGLMLPPGNPAFVIPLVTVAWLALTPYFEASSFLLHLDNRVRHDGLDLAYRVRSLFPVRSAALLLVLVGLAGAARAEGPEPQTTVREVRDGVIALRDEVKAADPYPGDGRYQKRLDALGKRLKAVAPDTARWFDRSSQRFGQLDREGARAALDDLDQKLALLQESLDRSGGDRAGPPRSREQIKEMMPDAGEGKLAPPPKPPEKRPDDPDQGEEGPAQHPGGGGGGALAPQVGGSGLGTVGWALLGGLALAVFAGALVLYLRQRGTDEAARPLATEALPGPHEPALQPDEQSAADLWRRAEALARVGDFLAAVRYLYLAVLTQLHRADLIRYERTRTNGEYLRQLRGAEGAAAVVEPFRRLTRLFEQKWYGDRACAPEDYETCHKLARFIASRDDKSADNS